jgi:class 3 adenylate cyclase
VDNHAAMDRRWGLAGVALALPLAGLALLLVRPELDLTWEHHPSHFWLVLGTAAVNVALAFLTNLAAMRHRDARIFLISLAFMASAGFLGLHALATPQTLLPAANAGFVIATPVGLLLASVLAAASVSPFAGPRGGALLRLHRPIRWTLVGLMVGWAVVSVLRIPPLRDPIAAEELNGPLTLVALVAVGLYGYAAYRYAGIARRRGSLLAVAMLAAMVLLAEAVIAVVLSRNWRLSWWEWHLLMAAAFGVIAYATRAEFTRTGSLTATLRPIYLEATLARVDRWHGRAMADLAALEARRTPIDSLLADLREDGATVEEVELLTAAAREMRRVDELFRPFLPQRLPERLLTGAAAHRPGGEQREVTVLFADLAGFTTFSETREPTLVIEMLNTYWAAVLPVIDEAQGSVEHFAGDGVLVLFNAVVDQPDHAERGARCGLRIHDVTAPIAERESWPRFRIGINTGPAVVGNVGAAGRLSFAAIGDTSNLASRLMSAAQPGGVVVGESTYRVLERVGGFTVRSLGRVTVKGKRAPVGAWSLE